MKKLITSLLLFFTVICFTNGESVLANAGASFSVQPVIPEIQIANTSYFDLTLTSSQTQEIAVQVFNDSEEEITVLAELNSASTSEVGNIHYQPTEEVDSSMAINIEDIVEQTEKKITLAPKASKEVTWTINMPDNDFEGILLGGLRFTLEQEENSSGIENRFAYTVGVVLRNNETPIPVNLNLGEIKPGQLNYRNHILATLQNDQARIIDDLSVTAEVFQEGNTKPLYVSENHGLRMAPNSSFGYAISTNETAFKPGKYTLKMTAIADEETFSWEEAFEIKSNDSSKLNKEAIINEEPSSNVWKWIALGMIALSLISLTYIKVKEKGRS